MGASLYGETVLLVERMFPLLQPVFPIFIVLALLLLLLKLMELLLPGVILPMGETLLQSQHP